MSTSEIIPELGVEECAKYLLRRKARSGRGWFGAVTSAEPNDLDLVRDMVVGEGDIVIRPKTPDDLRAINTNDAPYDQILESTERHPVTWIQADDDQTGDELSWIEAWDTFGGYLNQSRDLIRNAPNIGGVVLAFNPETRDVVRVHANDMWSVIAADYQLKS